MSYDFAEALKVLKAGYQVSRHAWAGSVHLEVLAEQLRLVFPQSNMDADAELWWSDYLAEDWFTVNPPHIDGTLDMVLEDAVTVIR